MAYEKQTWNNQDLSTPLSAARLNHLEDGIFNALENSAEGFQAVADSDELKTAFAQAFADTSITYDGSGNVATVTEAGVLTTYTYNGDGTVATDTRLGVTREYTYAPSGDLVSIEEVA